MATYYPQVSVYCYNIKLSFLYNYNATILTILVKRFIDEDRLPHLLFYGPPGTGKTSTILACAKMLYPPKEVNSMILEVIMSICMAVLS